MINICYLHGLNQSLLAKFAQLTEAEAKSETEAKAKAKAKAKSLFPFSPAIWDRLLRSNRCDSHLAKGVKTVRVRLLQRLNWLPF